MSIDAHLAELSEKHRMLEQKIAEEMTRPAADSGKISRWKHEKLKLKDQMARISGGNTHH
ncbi:MAG: YdcH family protein [Hyphomicrobiaceae bacterium]